MCSYSGGSVGVVAEYKDARFVLGGRAAALLCSQNIRALSLRC